MDAQNRSIALGYLPRKTQPGANPGEIYKRSHTHDKLIEQKNDG